MSRLWVLTVLCVAILAPPGECLMAMEVLKIVQIAFSSLEALSEYLLQTLERPGSPKFYTDWGEKKIVSQVDVLNGLIHDVDARSHVENDEILREIYSLKKKLMFSSGSKLGAIVDIMQQVDDADEQLREYLKKGIKKNNGTIEKINLERTTVEDFAKTMVSHDKFSIKMVSRNLHRNIMTKSDARDILSSKGALEELFDLLHDDNESKGFLCDVYQSPHQIIFNTYTMLQLTQLKAYTLLQFSYMLLRLYNLGNFTTESEILKNTFMDRVNQQEFEVKRVLDKSSRELWMCDPKKHVQGDTYTQLTNFIQGFLVNEVDLNSDNTCRENCGFYKYSKQTSCFKDQFCAKQTPCKGNIVGCQFVDSDMWVCQAPHFSGKRYEWIEYENGRTLGQRNVCSRAVTKVDSWWRYLFWHCSYCFCFCDDSSDEMSDRYFNLRPVTANVDDNKVVTGLKFVKSNRVIHLQIQEGELLEHGEINASTVAWRPIDNYKITDADVHVGVDYHMLTWEHRAIDLDDLKLPENHILTGVKLRMIGGHLNLEILGSEFNFTSGKLLNQGKKSVWISNDNTDGALESPRSQINLQKPDTPVKTSGLHYPDSKTDTFIEFTSSDVDLDVGQTPVPFIDTQAVVPRPPTPLTGAGLYHKGRQYSGGFVAPKVITLDYTEYIVTPDTDEIDF